MRTVRASRFLRTPLPGINTKTMIIKTVDKLWVSNSDKLDNGSHSPVCTGVNTKKTMKKNQNTEIPLLAVLGMHVIIMCIEELYGCI